MNYPGNGATPAAFRIAEKNRGRAAGKNFCALSQNCVKNAPKGL